MAFEASSFSMACIFAHNKIRYKNSASFIPGRVSTWDVIRMLTDFQKNDNIVNRKKQQHESISAFYRKWGISTSDSKRLVQGKSKLKRKN